MECHCGLTAGHSDPISLHLVVMPSGCFVGRCNGRGKNCLLFGHWCFGCHDNAKIQANLFWQISPSWYANQIVAFWSGFFCLYDLLLPKGRELVIKHIKFLTIIFGIHTISGTSNSSGNFRHSRKVKFWPAFANLIPHHSSLAWAEKSLPQSISIIAKKTAHG